MDGQKNLLLHELSEARYRVNSAMAQCADPDDRLALHEIELKLSIIAVKHNPEQPAQPSLSVSAVNS